MRSGTWSASVSWGVLLILSAATALAAETDFEEFGGFRVFDSDFTIGASPFTARFVAPGGGAARVGVGALYNSGLKSWMVAPGTGAMGIIEFQTPAARVAFWARDSTSLQGGAQSQGQVTAFGPAGEVLAGPVAMTNLFQQVVFEQRSSGAPIARIEVVNLGEPDSWANVDTFSACSADEDPDDLDCDLNANATDLCPFFPETDPGADRDGDGRGDACECADQTGDGLVDVTDILAINEAIFEPTLVTELCDGNNDGQCNVGDILAANMDIFEPNSSTCSRQPEPGP